MRARGSAGSVRLLQAQLGTPGEDVDCSASPSPPSTAGEKVALFRGLFRGRDDVFPKLWVNPRTDRKGYAPACSNEWLRGVCEKPRVKCSECPNQAFISVSDQVVLGPSACGGGARRRAGPARRPGVA